MQATPMMKAMQLYPIKNVKHKEINQFLC